MKVKIFITGGTIDDLEYASEKQAPKNHQSLVPELLEKMRIRLDYNCEVLMQKDSKFITEKDKELILKKCQECKEDKIIITHGTMTIVQTAQYLGQRKLRKTIVLTGAMVPINKKETDGPFNLGTAFTAVQLLPEGVYITMNGKVFNWDSVRKNLDTGYFE